MLRDTFLSEATTTASRSYKGIVIAYLAVAVSYVLFFGLIKLIYMSSLPEFWNPVRSVIHMIAAALWLFAAPMLLLAFPGQWLPPQMGLPWELVGQILVSSILLCIFAWLAHLQPTARRRWLVALILGLWVLAVPLLEVIQMYTPIAVDELF